MDDKNKMKKRDTTDLPIALLFLLLGTFGVRSLFKGRIGDTPEGKIMIILIMVVFVATGVFYMNRYTSKKKEYYTYIYYFNLFENTKHREFKEIGSYFEISEEEVHKELNQLVKKGFFSGSYIDSEKNKIVLKDEQ